ncbi:helix-turn-helix domain-containing protein [Oceanibaculum nanhaiense]|uniref:helix-turn-helix domain-containing protein n=1 Tax=Oceanibaculum nanhaiense TaxID=1909734 RepID=UPI001C3E7126|nr:helix-turn-helix transcriptional regulator [Oceanibaculum nanhaiense]
MKNEQEIKEFGLEVRRRRIALGLSQEQFAEISGLHRTYVSGIERGDRNPTIDIIFQISRALRCPPGALLSGE